MQQRASSYGRPLGLGIGLMPMAVCAIACALFILRSAFVADGSLLFSLFDDVMISMRYARNLVEGHGLVWNSGERPVEGYTNFLWVLALAVLHLVPISDRWIALLVSLVGAIVLVLTVHFTVRLARRYSASPFAASAAGILTALCYPLMFWTLRGMEVGLLALLMVFAVEQGLRLADGETQRPAAMLTAMALITLLRPDGLVPACLIGAGIALAIPHRRRVRLVMFVAVPVLIFMLHMAARHWYYGEWVPNTYYLKMTGVSALTRISRGLRAMRHSAIWYLGLPFAFAVLNRRTYRNTAYVLPLATSVTVCLYAVYVGGDAWEWMPYTIRYVTATLPLLFATVPFDDDPSVRSGRRLFQVAAICGAVLLLRPLWAGGDASPMEVAIRVLAAVGLAAGLFVRRRVMAAAVTLAIVTSISLPGVAEWAVSRGVYTRSDTEAALLGSRLRDAVAPDARIAVVAAGNIAYFARRHAIDLLGKNDAVIARRPPVIDFHPGHDRWDYTYSIGELKPEIVAQLWHVTPDDREYFRRVGYTNYGGWLLRTDLDADAVRRVRGAFDDVSVVPLF